MPIHVLSLHRTKHVSFVIRLVFPGRTPRALDGGEGQIIEDQPGSVAVGSSLVRKVCRIASSSRMISRWALLGL